MRRYRHQIYSAVVFVCAMTMGGFFALNSWDGTVYIYVEDSRTPAAVQKHLDISNLKGTDLRAASRDRLLTDAHVISEAGVTGIELGHFITKDAEGVKQFACHTYQRVRLVYQAEGMAESGDIPQMIVEGPCQMSAEDINHIAPLWIPEKQIRANKPHDFDIDYEVQETAMSFHFHHIGTQWPNQWSLQSAMLYDPDQANLKLEFSQAEVISQRPRHLSLHWDDDVPPAVKPDPSDK